MLGRENIIKIRQNPFTDELEIYFGFEDNKGLNIAKPVKLEYNRIDEGGEAKPTFLIPRGVASNFLEAILGAIEDQGIKPESTSKTEGLLEATKYHLEDMRKIVFNKEKE